MRHWDTALPGRILRVLHEEWSRVSKAVSGEFWTIGPAFEAACFEFHKTERSVRTASSEQVRQPDFS